MAPPIFVELVYFNCSKNLTYLALTVQKFKILEDPIEGIPPTWLPDFIPALVLPVIFNCSKFEFSAFSGLKVDNRRRKRKKSKEEQRKKKEK